MNDLALFVGAVGAFLGVLVILGLVADWIEPPGAGDARRRNGR